MALEQHIESAQSEERLACLFGKGRSDSGRPADSVLKWARWWVDGLVRSNGRTPAVKRSESA